MTLKPCPDCGRPIGSRTVRCMKCFNDRRWGRTAPPDDVVIDRLAGGIQTASTASERIEAVRILTGYGLSARLIAERLRVTERTVVRYRRAA